MIEDLPWLLPPPADFADRCKTVSDASDLLALANHKIDEKASRQLRRALARFEPVTLRQAGIDPFRLIVLAAHTFDFLADCIPAAALRRSLAVEVTVAPYGQIMQMALDPGSTLYSNPADACLLSLDVEWLGLNTTRVDGGAAELVEEALARVSAAATAIKQGTGRAVILQNLAPHASALFGSLDRRIAGSRRRLIQDFNSGLATLAAGLNCPVLDVAMLAEDIGTGRWFNPVQWNAYKLPCDAAYAPVYADWLARLLGAMRGKSRKCLVLDLDNTTWGGVIGDDGLAGIEIGQGSARGEAFLSVQRYALELRSRGIMLAVSSKNEDHTARLPFREHADMLLKEEHISVFQANWIDKASNLESIARALSIGVDALVMLDDNPAERAAIRAALPAVAVPELPTEPARYVEVLAAAGYFEAESFSQDDLTRVASIEANAQRAEVLQKSRSVGEYLNSLQMEMSFKPFEPESRQRITQLANKTNQFNLTTRRYSEAEIERIESEQGVFTRQVRLRDRFGDMGLISLLIARPHSSEAACWDIETWLMSCRVLGRQVEQSLLRETVSAAKAQGIRSLRGTFIPTPKNGMVADHYAKLGFTEVSRSHDGRTEYRLDLDA